MWQWVPHVLEEVVGDLSSGTEEEADQRRMVLVRDE